MAETILDYQPSFFFKSEWSSRVDSAVITEDTVAPGATGFVPIVQVQ